ncbi:hypothetical protein ACSHT0_11210 [Tepidicaulis sp. LMO-SS28]|uniref:hypothetical protein n=1 Tax=Tepidicaulis sp. LMO-SS28 TaxID=3447455 RepID=UPI003EDF02BD
MKKIDFRGVAPAVIGAAFSVIAFTSAAHANERYMMMGGGTSVLYEVYKEDGTRHHYVERCGTRWYFNNARAKEGFLNAGFGGLKAGHVHRVRDGKSMCSW